MTSMEVQPRARGNKQQYAIGATCRDMMISKFLSTHVQQLCGSVLLPSLLCPHHWNGEDSIYSLTLGKNRTWLRHTETKHRSRGNGWNVICEMCDVTCMAPHARYNVCYMFCGLILFFFFVELSGGVFGTYLCSGECMHEREWGLCEEVEWTLDPKGRKAFGRICNSQ